MAGLRHLTLRKAVIAASQQLGALGISQGTSGNVSVRAGDGLLVTPSGIPYDELTPGQIVWMDPEGPLRGRLAAVQRMAISLRYPARTAGTERRGPHPRRPCHRPRLPRQGDPRLPLYGRRRRGAGHPVCALRDLRHRGTVGKRRSGARRPAGPACWRITELLRADARLAMRWRSRPKSKPWHPCISRPWKSGRPMNWTMLKWAGFCGNLRLTARTPGPGADRFSRNRQGVAGARCRKDSHRRGV